MMGNRELELGASCGDPDNATNIPRFSTAKWSDMNVAYRILGGGMPSREGSRGTARPRLCRAMHGWLKKAEARRAKMIDTDRLSWLSHEAFYGNWMVALCFQFRWAHEKWIRSLFRCLGMQFQVNTAEALAEKSFVS